MNEIEMTNQKKDLRNRATRYAVTSVVAFLIVAFSLLGYAGEPGPQAGEARETNRIEVGPAGSNLPERNPHESHWDDIRRPPTDRFDFRGEHAGTIYTPGGWRRLNVDRSMIGPNFLVPYENKGGQTFYVPYPQGRSARSRGHSSGRDSEFIGLGASYEIVTPKPRATDRNREGGRWELRAEQVPVPGECVEVYHPAVYEVDDEGKHQLVEAAETTRVAKVKIVLRKTWVTP